MFEGSGALVLFQNLYNQYSPPGNRVQGLITLEFLKVTKVMKSAAGFLMNLTANVIGNVGNKFTVGNASL